ncbi:DUF3084 domain-containing protein [Roseofilum capinflatum]|uniref:DUF3084 domain-containing protein n=1 Tax=Roseofilum capinflatum BLCC-M114 TaxID=3022440 RepID=A0ABT7BDK9_9CYAN|nr:DUF3084 domain-containing protein [Roseofilum capinflatum]MDJ1176363.1 DUF3084 domain-containing protein [Roseofilum capinflatum BLCC-M114]
MTIGIILIVSILFLGGLLATLGDRLGTKVGKARLSLFNLRPRQTAVLVTIVTGTLISGSTLGILFAMSQPLRRGIFEYDETQRKLRQARRELQSTQAQKAQIEIDLAQARAERELVQENLDNLNASLQTVIAQKSATEENLDKTQAQLREIQANFEKTQVQLQQVMGKFQQAQDQLQRVNVQTETLRSELEQLRSEREELIRQQNEVKSQIAQRDEEIAERNELIAQRDEEIENRDREIEDRNQVIEEREERLKELENQQKFLERQVRIFEQYYQDYQDLRQGNLALLRGQILASVVVEILDPQGSVQAVNRLLEIANQSAREQVKPGTGQLNEQVIQVTEDQVKQLQERIADGQEYVVRLLSAGNYIRGESNVEIFADVALNQVVFESGEVIATGITNGATMSEEELIEQIGILIESCRFRARRGGILESRLQVGDGSPETLMNFVEKIQENPTRITIQAIASETTYTAGPLRIDLVAFEENEEVFRTSSPMLRQNVQEP